MQIRKCPIVYISQVPNCHEAGGLGNLTMSPSAVITFCGNDGEGESNIDTVDYFALHGWYRLMPYDGVDSDY